MGKGKGQTLPPPPRSGQSTTPRPPLRNPASLGPPPKRFNSYGSPSSSSTAPSQKSDADLRSVDEETPIGHEAESAASAVDHVSEKPPPPALPSRANTMPRIMPQLPPRKEDPALTGLRPSVPPRLPLRHSSNATEKSESEQEQSNGRDDGTDESGYLNKGAMDRLGRVGVSVPGFNIGKSLPLRESKPSTQPAGSSVPSTGTSFAQKQAALRTAAAFRRDPKSVSLADAKSAAATANNFRERHGSQVGQGWKAANALNSKYGVTDRMGAQPANRGTNTESLALDAPEDSRPAGLKKPPPLPPKRKDVSSEDAKEPPPVPFASKPR